MIRPGPIVLGALLAVGGGALAALPLLALADTTTPGGQTVLIAMGFLVQFAAGMIAAWMAGADRALTGGLAALLSHAIVAAVALASQDEPSVFALAFGAVVALVLGTAGGVLMDARSRE